VKRRIRESDCGQAASLSAPVSDQAGSAASNAGEYVDQREETERHAEQPGEYVSSHCDLRKPRCCDDSAASMQEAHQREARDPTRTRVDVR